MTNLSRTRFNGSGHWHQLQWGRVLRGKRHREEGSGLEKCKEKNEETAFSF
jgi:hypothetical protein